MTIVPILPSVFKELIVQPEESVVQALVKIAVRLPVVLYKLWKWAFTAAGEATPEFRAWICEGCAAAKAAADAAKKPTTTA